MNKRVNKMDCMHYRGKIDDYIDGRLEEGERSSMEDHLQSCPDCMEMVRVQRFADRIIDEEKKSAADLDLSSKIMGRIDDLPGEKDSALIRVLRPVAITTSAAAAIFAGVTLGSLTSKQERMTIPVELSLMNDIDIEAIDLLSAE